MCFEGRALGLAGELGVGSERKILSILLEFWSGQLGN